uniref:Uncharacterized protein n=1 Tax=Anguilla anguilla TaxID=7936 RepID=A0A0E9VIS2_ANGAN
MFQYIFTCSYTFNSLYSAYMLPLLQSICSFIVLCFYGASL